MHMIQKGQRVCDLRNAGASQIAPDLQMRSWGTNSSSVPNAMWLINPVHAQHIVTNIDNTTETYGKNLRMYISGLTWRM